MAALRVIKNTKKNIKIPQKYVNYWSTLDFFFYFFILFLSLSLSSLSLNWFFKWGLAYYGLTKALPLPTRHPYLPVHVTVDEPYAKYETNPLL